MRADRWAGLGIYSRGPNRLLPRLSRGVRVEYEYIPRPAATSTFSESRGGQEGNGCWLTGAVSVVFVGFSDGSSAVIKSAKLMQRSCRRHYKGYGIALPAPLRHLSLTERFSSVV